MKGTPRHINTKQDVVNILNNCGECGREFINGLISEAERRVWVHVGDLKDNDRGIEDDSHKILKNGDGTRLQMKLITNPSSILKRIGMTTEEAKRIINDR